MTGTKEAPVHALLGDGTTVRIRQAGSADREEVLRLYQEMSPENLRLRFFSANPASAGKAADRVAAGERPGYRALAAEYAGHLVGLAEYEVLPPGSTAEISVAVADGWHRRGVATLLLEHLADAARTAGVTAFSADALAENHDVLKVFHDLGLRVTSHFDGPEVHCTVELTEDNTYLNAVEIRGRVADVVSLQPLLRPRAVVVIGAGRKPGSVGRAILRNIRTSSYTGLVYAVHPEAAAVAGVHAYSSVADLPQVPDLAVIAIPAAYVDGVAEECGKAGVRALLVVSAGLNTHQAAGLMGSCRRHGMRLVGPNCLGLANTEDRVRLDATFAARHPGPGTAGVAVQSGGVGIALLDGLARLGIGASSFVSLGDKYDVSGNDMLQWWESDGHTDLALLHLESFGNPRAFSRTARRVARAMPILTVDAGRSEAGRRAAASHTAAAATPTMTRQALFTQAGITATRTIGELLDTAALLHAQPLAAGTKVVVVSNAGGAGVLAADACTDAGLVVPALSADLMDELLGLLPDGATATNPVDVTAAVGEKQLQACVSLLARHGAVNAVLVALVPTAVAAATGEDLVRALTSAPEPLPRPVVAVLPAQAARVELLPAADESTVPAYSDAEDAARALAHTAARADWLSRLPSSVPDLPSVETGRARDLAAAYLDGNPKGGWLDPQATAALLACYGIPQIPWAWARDEDEAVDAAERLAGPDGRVVMKAYWPGLLHKSEQHALHLDLHNASQIRAAHRDLVTRFGDRMTGVVIQPLAERGTELFAGVVQDEVFGPLVVFGLGGTATELLADHAARLAPLTELDAHDLLTSPRCSPLLFGYAGRPTADLGALEQLLHRLSRMASDLPQLADVDLNPVLAGAHGITTLDARVRLVPRHAHDPYLRRLR
ncbi:MULTISPECIES: bifunctional acetate--CoA ligase family protein/GNAT family N-acetyltransferase [unclassified Streptomyces]|uniref:bifunctional acetate--CoA ligase family protein/GNAT family N-acetyltransferase n=1 Tax=unclassified Streptomyces TaxID=2593676 RepID=UPI002DD83068|nr:MULTISPECIES: GNAT family N-acetyltransferase [unclassified Streptomyces]WSC34828.1 GNAT family N-acetyltransferase [Streptomyces sp. NBC_01763]WSC57899.1 GNAT family N-acetyltransferase [Streptomyces sp. NBC_01761]WSF89000.1 GNAT family N-acetyltransferase [Streptomyces sp. NBC_01744]